MPQIRSDEDPAARTGLPDLDEPFALFLDFDGTLVNIAAKPDAVQVAPQLPGILAALRERLEGALAIVSGRPIAVLDAYLAPERFDAAGLHGAEQRFGSVVQVDAASDPARLRPILAELKALAGKHPGLIVEDKGRSVAIHWRLAPRSAAIAVSVMRAASEGLGADYRLQEGKNVLEILPRWATKGAAIARFLDQEPFRDRRPVFIGDDVTDEHGFEVVEQRGGVAIRIGEGDTCASYRLPDPDALRHVLARWSAPAAPAGQETRRARTLQERP
ncbi:MAG: trehalose-phosphatase [Alsobacter sp.]